MLEVDPEAKAIAEIVQQWVVKAEEDLGAAQLLVTPCNEMFFSSVCFHAPQCVEKYVKALLTLHQLQVPRTHNLALLLPLLPPHLRPIISEKE